MKISTRLTGLLTAVALVASPMAMAEMNRTQGTIVGAAVGGVAGSMIGNNLESTLLGAAAGGLLGNLLAKNNANYTREGYHNNRYYYGGREFRNRKDYEAYREAVNRDMLRGKEARRYANYRDYRREHASKRNNNKRGTITAVAYNDMLVTRSVAVAVEGMAVINERAICFAEKESLGSLFCRIKFLIGRDLCEILFDS